MICSKTQTGGLHSNELAEIRFCNVEWTELTRDGVSKFETWQWIRNKVVKKIL